MTGWLGAPSARRVKRGANFLNGSSRYCSQRPSGSIVCRSLVGGRLDSKRLAFREGDGTSIPEPARSFEWIWCGDVLHHIVETEQALKEFLRVVRPGGRIIIKESQVLSALFLPGHPELER